MGDEVKFTVIATGFRNEAMPARRERMMAGAGLPTVQHDGARCDVVPPRIVTRPVVPRFASEPEQPAAAAEPVIFASQAAMSAIRVEAEPAAVEHRLETQATEQVAAPTAVVPAAVVPIEVVPEPVAEVPVERSAYPVSSYYETARQQAWQEPAPRIEFASNAPVRVEQPVEQARPPQEAVPEEPKVVMHVEPVHVPVIVEHIPEVTRESSIQLPNALHELHGESQREAAIKESSPELLPVRASVFDDDFFRRPKVEDASRGMDEAVSKPWPDARVPSFSGYAAEGSAENDELDIPAFLRRKQ
jgi:cell division protein FtsZ